MRYDEHLVSIPNAVRVSARRFGDRDAVIDATNRLTFRQLEEAMLACVRAMMALGVAPGDRVALWAPNSARWVLAALGIQGAGGVLVPVNTRFKGDEAAYVLRKSGATALVVVTDFLDADYIGMLQAADPDLPVLRPGRIVVASGDAAEGQLSWDAFLAAGQRVSPEAAITAIDALSADDLSDIMFTSGTTGHPKGVMLTHGQSLRAHGWLAQVMDFRAGDRYLIIPPFFHTFGYKAGWMACIVHGVTALPLAVFSVDEVLDIIERERISILLGPPALFQGILDAPERGEHDLSSIRVTMASAASVSPELVLRMREELGARITHTAYGLTEATSLVTTTYPLIDSIEAITTTVGRPAWGVEVRIVDDSGRDVGAGVPGELLCRGYNVMRGYWEDPQQTAAAISADGWLHTGDIAVRDEEGYIRITDRKKDVIIVGGFNVYPAEVERILGQHPDVDCIAVVGAPDRRLGEVAVAFVVPRPGSALSADGFRAWAATRIANFKCPRRVFLVPELPRNASMKVLKNDLRRRALSAGTCPADGVQRPAPR
ncbi:long-chain fatty acid--CoA ligase [Mycolicibacter senuensis]|uniref:AMP-binding protein n=1 Tax=Mycolicibacter kumamotonensis TaxID=354243 RepID=A0A7K3LCL8_9MYCO|nr:AMP-binding protein [Mycolicibacter kumamotonensis]RAV02866.1 long-chain fatty acid--CoA ligase [Mycolicibacter senuensis]